MIMEGFLLFMLTGTFIVVGWILCFVNDMVLKEDDTPMTMSREDFYKLKQYYRS